MSLSEESPLRDLPDRAIRQTLRHAEHLRVFLEQVVPAFAPRPDCSRAQLRDRLFPLEDWRDREADLPFEIPFRVGAEEVWALVVVLIEHQSDTDRLMPLRLLLFAVLYWEKQWAEWKQLPSPRPPLRLRPVLPIVLYTGSSPWGSTRTVVELLGEPTELHAFAPRWEPLIWNLADQQPEDLLASSSAWLKALAVVRVEDADTEAFGKVFRRAVQELAPLASVDLVRWHELMRLLLTWLFWRRPDAERTALIADAVARQPDKMLQQEIESMNRNLGPTAAELCVAEGVKIGEERGVKIGERKGQLQAARTLLQALLEDRFGAIPDSLRQRIEATEDLERLGTASRQVYRIQAIDDLPL